MNPESNVWFVLERIVSLVTIAVLAFAIWNTGLRIENKQVQQSREINATLEAIKQRMDENEWQDVQNNLLDHKSVR